MCRYQQTTTATARRTWQYTVMESGLFYGLQMAGGAPSIWAEQLKIFQCQRTMTAMGK